MSKYLTQLTRSHGLSCRDVFGVEPAVLEDREGHAR